MKKAFLRTALLLLTIGAASTASAGSSVSSYETYGPWQRVSTGPCLGRMGPGTQTVTFERTVSVIKVVSYTPDPGQTFTPYRVKTLDYQYTGSYVTTESCEIV